MTRAQKATLVLLLGAAAVPVTGCGSSPSPAAAQSSKGQAAQAFAYARCIRQHGIPDFPDPRVDTSPGSTRISQGVPASAGLSPNFPAAQKACRAIMPAPHNGGPSDQGPRKQVLLAFAHCLRAHGVNSFPDPNAQGQLTTQMIAAAGVDIHAPGLLTAAKACVAVTHGAITMAQVEAAINHP
jgi:hypothetical protein